LWQGLLLRSHVLVLLEEHGILVILKLLELLIAHEWEITCITCGLGDLVHSWKNKIAEVVLLLRKLRQYRLFRCSKRLLKMMLVSEMLVTDIFLSHWQRICQVKLLIETRF
jgi:hypothetical protein